MPVRRAHPEGPGQPAAVQRGIGRTLRGVRILAGRHGVDVGRRQRQGQAGAAGLARDEAGVLMPAGIARGAQVVQAERIVALAMQIARHGQRGNVGDIGRVGRRAALVADHAQGLGLAQGHQHGFEEAVAEHAIDPGRPEDQVRRIGRLHGAFAGQLAASVHVQGRGLVILDIGRGLGAVEHVIGRVVHHQRAARGGQRRQLANRLGVDPHGAHRVFLGALHGGPGRGIDDHVGLFPTHEPGYLQRIGQVAIIPARRRHHAQRRQAATQLETQLPIPAQQQNLLGHALALRRPPRLSTGPLRSARIACLSRKYRPMHQPSCPCVRHAAILTVQWSDFGLSRIRIAILKRNLTSQI